ncbi:unnamed protein product [Allacma fusca]|uniref:Uncharacterized protein n=1 Tax=Allacma fusca TaxID=39272 RepID=A0A8J2K0V0_9HEXA|nr:unnamed protein product [Allacma fusca]
MFSLQFQPPWYKVDFSVRGSCQIIKIPGTLFLRINPRKALPGSRLPKMTHNNYYFKEVPNGSAPAAVFSDKKIVKCIFKHLKKNFQDVRTFRLISPTCNEISLSRFSAKSKINTKRLHSLSVKSPDIFAIPDSLKHRFGITPAITSLEVKGFPSLSSPGVKSFLQIHGQHINHLTLLGPMDAWNILNFQMLIADWLPSLRTLIFNSRNLHNSHYPTGTSLLTGNRTLQNLKELSFGSDIFKINPLTKLELIIFQDILLASPNLECLKIFEPELLDVVLACNKGHLLKELTFYPKILLGYRHTRKYFKYLRRQSPKLREIEFCANTLKTDEEVRQLRADVTSCLLTQSKDSLETLKITFDDTSPGKSYPLQLDLPVFSNVTSMNFSDLCLLSYTKPHGSHISEFLPALRRVVVNSRIFSSIPSADLPDFSPVSDRLVIGFYDNTSTGAERENNIL